jgi:hypothetical protein
MLSSRPSSGRWHHLQRHAAVAAPVVGHGAAAMRDHQAQRREILEQVALQQLHEHRGVGVQVVRAGAVEARVARGRHVDHGRHVQLAQRLVQRIPLAVGHRRAGPVAAARVRVQVAADEAHLLDAAAQLGNEFFGGASGDCGSWPTGAKLSGYMSQSRGAPGRSTPRPIRGWCARCRGGGSSGRRSARTASGRCRAPSAAAAGRCRRLRGSRRRSRGRHPATGALAGSLAARPAWRASRGGRRDGREVAVAIDDHVLFPFDLFRRGDRRTARASTCGAASGPA